MGGMTSTIATFTYLTMTTKLRYDIERLKDAMSVIADFNSLDLHHVALYENNQLIPVTEAQLDDWRFVGLSNKSFVELEFWNWKEQ